jgi:alpha-L-arabinofuranosidase
MDRFLLHGDGDRWIRQPGKDVCKPLDGEVLVMMTFRPCVVRWLCFVIGTGFLLTAGSAFGTEIRVDAAQDLGQANIEVFGNSVIFGGDVMGFNRWVSDEAGYEEAKAKWNYYLPLLSEMGPTVIRYPGGLTANNFHWKPGIGPITERDPNFTDVGIPQTFGTDEFLQYCEELGAEAILVVNVSTNGKRAGSVQDAADWVEYCNAPNDGANPGGGTDWAAVRAANGHNEPYRVTYWELGNEETYPGFENYAERVTAYSSAMKAIDPTIVVGVISSGAGLDAIYGQQAWLDYRTLMLERAGESFDFWTQHVHTPGSDSIDLIREGASVEVDFTIEEAGEYSVELEVAGQCRSLQCPVLSLSIDGENVGQWSGPIYGLLRTDGVRLNPGTHVMRLQAGPLVRGARLSVVQKVLAYREGDPEPLWVDLKKSLDWYHSLFGGWGVTEMVYRIGEPYAGGKPVYYTETNTVYMDVRTPPYYAKACHLREMLSTGCIYHFMLREGIPLANHWLLFHDRAGIGVLEGVAEDRQAGEAGRLDPHKRPVFHLLKAYRWNVFEELVSTEVVDAPSFPVGPQTGLTIGYAVRDFDVSYVQALATKTPDGNKLSLFVINLHPEQDLEVPVLLEGFPRKASVDVLTITGASPHASNDPEDCPGGECVTTERQNLRLGGNPFSYTFPKHSVTVFIFSATGSDDQPPRAPNGLSGSAGNGNAFLFWNANPENDLQGYNLYRSRCAAGPYRYRVNAEPIEIAEYLDTGVDNDVTYTYAVTAVDRSGNESSRSAKISVAVGGGDEPPVGEDETPPSPPILIQAD